MCSEKLETIERMIARSSTHWPTWGNKSLTGIPLSPYRRNFHGQPSTLPTLLNCVGWVLTLIGLAVFAVEARLGVERVDLRRSAIHEQEDDAPRLRREV